jgi:serine/threonine protein kinase
MSRHRTKKEKDTDTVEAAEELLRADVLRYMQVKRNELKLEDKLGNGSYGDIHRARLFGMSVAVKAIKPGLADDDFEDFQRECQLLTSMNHPHIVQAIGCVVGDGTCDHPPLLILELCERGSLDNYVRGRPRLSVSTVVQISLGIAAGLNYLHHRGIIHRDIKSGNILLTKYLQAKIADFGLCHVTEGKKIRGSFGEVGTPSFMYVTM